MAPTALPLRKSERIIIGVRSALTAALLTALLAALVNWTYERSFAPALYAAGHPLARAVFVIVLTFPFILSGILILGIPAALVLRRLQIQNFLTFAIAGAVTGIVWGQTVVALVRPTFGITPYIVDAIFGATSMMLFWWIRPRGLAIP